MTAVSLAPMTAAGTRTTPCLSVVVPCYNETLTLKHVAEQVLSSPYTRELIIVDDGSTDDSLAVARSLADPRVRVIAQPINMGKGAALRRGFKEATSEFVIVQDADLEYDPREYEVVLAPLLDGRADVVYGSRFHSSQPHRVLYYWHSMGNRLLTTLSNMATNLNLTDMETCYKAFRREVIQSIQIEEDRFGFEPEITAKLSRAHWRIYEVGISYSGRTYEEGKKIGWKDGVRALWCIARYSSPGTALRERSARRHREHAPAGDQEADRELAETLDNLDDAPNYVDWVLGELGPHLGEEVLEIGSGHGTLAAVLLHAGHRMVLSDLSERCVRELNTRFAGEDVEVVLGDAVEACRGRTVDSVIAVNVLEHIPDDAEAVRAVYDALRPGGTFVLWVPSHEWLYSPFDRMVGHHRRYRRSAICELLGDAGFEVVKADHVNAVGVAAWWLGARQLGRNPTERWSVRLFDRAVPALRSAEQGRRLRFGQSLAVVARKPA